MTFSEALAERAKYVPNLLYRVKHESINAPLQSVLVEFDIPKARLKYTFAGRGVFRCAYPLCNMLIRRGSHHITLNAYHSKPVAKWCMECASRPNFMTLVTSSLPRYKRETRLDRLQKIQRVRDGEQRIKQANAVP